MENMCDVPTHLHDHVYWRREPSRSQSGTDTTKAGGSRKRWREQDSSFRSSEEPPERRFREDAAVLSERSLSPQPSTSTPPASLEGVQLEQDIQVRVPQEPVGDSQQDDLTAPPAWPSPYGPQPGGLSPSAYNLMAEMVMAWMMDSPYNPEM